MDWEEYLKNELAYYDEHPEEDAPIIEAHTNDCAMIEISYMDWTSSQSVHFYPTAPQNDVLLKSGGRRKARVSNNSDDLWSRCG